MSEWTDEHGMDGQFVGRQAMLKVCHTAGKNPDAHALWGQRGHAHSLGRAKGSAEGLGARS
jgi:hypothetical protein